MSRKIDALIAEHVMGWDMSKRLMADVPNYSTSIQDAWLVVEKIKDYTFFSIEFEGIAGWHVTLGVQIDYDQNTQDQDTYSETAPMAICLAALKAEGVEVGD